MDVPGKERSSKSLYFFPVNKITKSRSLSSSTESMELKNVFLGLSSVINLRIQ